jgi:hypothetical protein
VQMLPRLPMMKPFEPGGPLPSRQPAIGEYLAGEGKANSTSVPAPWWRSVANGVVDQSKAFGPLTNKDMALTCTPLKPAAWAECLVGCPDEETVAHMRAVLAHGWTFVSRATGRQK